MSQVASKLKLTKVGRVVVTVADTDRAIDFYVGTLGFEKVVDVPMGPDMRWVEVALPGHETTTRSRRRPRASIRAAPRPGSASTRPTSTPTTPRYRPPAPTSTRRSAASAVPSHRCSGSATRTAIRC